MTAYVFKRKRPPVLQYTGDYTKTGSFGQINKGIAGGFSASNYLTLPMDFNPSNSPWSITTAIHFVDGSSGQRILGSRGNIYGLALQTHTSTKTLHLYGSSNGSSWNLMSDLRGVTPLVDGTDYWVKMEYSGSQYIVSLSTNGVDWNDEITVNNATPLYAFKTFYIGSNAVETFLFGSIDLSQSYINIDGERWWSGDSYTKVGGWIDDNVVSGFSPSNYLKLPQTFNPSSKAWEWSFKFTMGSDVSTTAYILGCTNTSGSHGAMFGMVYGKFTCWLSANGTSWNIATDGTTTTALVVGETYYIKFGWTGSEYYIDLSTNGIDYVREYSLKSTTAVHSSAFNIGSAWQLSYPFKGSIDLTESYIKVDGEYWWQGAKYVNADRLYVFKRKRPKEYRKTVIDTATAGTYTFDVAKDTTARIILVGGGGAGGQVWEGHAEGSGGGSGACVYCAVKLTAGTYTITNGAAGVFPRGNAGNSTLSLGDTTLITAGGGTGGQDSGREAGVGGTYSFADSVEIEKIIFASNGKTGVVGGNMTGGQGGASVYKGYGKGGNTRTGGNAGYIFVELTTDETDYDYKIENDACYILKRKQYWKYEYQDYTLPVMTSNIAPEGVVTYDIGIGGPYATSSIYQIFWNSDKGININGLYNQATRYLKYTFAKLLKAGKYTFTYSASRQASVTNTMNKWEAILEDDSRVQIMNPTVTTSSQTFSVEFEVNKPIKAINLTLYASAPSEASCYYMISKIALTGEGLPESIVTVLKDTVPATKDDYDFTTD